MENLVHSKSLFEDTKKQILSTNTEEQLDLLFAIYNTDLRSLMTLSGKELLLNAFIITEIDFKLASNKKSLLLDSIEKLLDFIKNETHSCK